MADQCSNTNERTSERLAQFLMSLLFLYMRTKPHHLLLCVSPSHLHLLLHRRQLLRIDLAGWLAADRFASSPMLVGLLTNVVEVTRNGDVQLLC